MSRKSTIDTKDGNNSKMVVVLEKNRAGGSQKKQEFTQNFAPSNNHGLVPNKVLQVSTNGPKSLKSKLNNKQNPFYAGPGPKVLPIEITNQRLFNQIKTPQSALMGNMSVSKNQFMKQDNRGIKTFTPVAQPSEIRYQDQQPQSIFNFNQSPTAAS